MLAGHARRSALVLARTIVSAACGSTAIRADPQPVLSLFAVLRRCMPRLCRCIACDDNTV